jgi:hypothetical protein
MRKLSLMVVVAAIVATLTGGTSAVAEDVSILCGGPPSGPPNGFFTITDGANLCGRHCDWQGNDAWYGDTAASGGGNCNDMATSAWNNGYDETYDAVAMNKDINNSGLKINLCRGDYLLDMSRNRWPNFTNANNSVSSHKWVIAWWGIC